MASPAQPRPVPTTPGFSSVIFDSQQLRRQPFLNHLQDLVNDAYHGALSDLPVLGPDGQRLHEPDTLASEMGTHGRCCLIFRKEDEQMSKPLASAIIKYFNDDLGGVPVHTVHVKAASSSSVNNGSLYTVANDSGSNGVKVEGYREEPADLLDIKHWEPSVVCVSPSDTSLRGLGLAAHCVSELERDLLERLHAAEKEKRERDNEWAGQAVTSSKPPSSDSLSFWVRATIKTNAAYWQRRGYNPLLVDRFPVGFWDYHEETDVMTLKREVTRLPMNTH